MIQELVDNPSTDHGLMMKLENELNWRSRNYGSENHSNTAIRPKLVIDYTVEDDYATEINHIFEHMDPADVPTGILLDYGVQFAPMSDVQGTRTADNFLDINGWMGIYGTLAGSVFDPTKSITTVQTVSDRLQNYRETEVGKTQLAGLYFEYDAFKANAETAGYVTISNGQIFDNPSSSVSPYESRTSFGLAIDGSVYEGLNHDFVLHTDMFLTNTSKTLQYIQIDFGDGAGFRTITFGSNVSVTYPSIGEKTIEYNVRYTDGTMLYGHSKVLIEQAVDGSNVTTFLQARILLKLLTPSSILRSVHLTVLRAPGEYL